jgi:hypothetical protein
MKDKPTSIEVSVGDLRPALAALSKVVPSTKSASSSLQCIKVETLRRKSIRLSASDGDTFFAVDLPAAVESQAEPALVPLARLREQIRGARIQEPVAIRTVEDPPLAEFPEAPKFRATAIELEPPVVGSLLRAISIAEVASRSVISP